MNNKIKWILIAALAVVLTAALEAAPPFISVQDRVKESDVILLGRIKAVKRERRNKFSYRAVLFIDVKETYKGKVPKEIQVELIIEPDGYGGYLREPPTPSTYIFFLNRARIKSRDLAGKALTPYDPQMFCFLEPTDDNVMEVQLYLFDKNK